MQYPDSAAWRRRLERDAVLPEGFQSAVSSLSFIPEEKPDAGALGMNLALLRLDEPTDSFAGVFTRNAFPGWPVVVGRERMSEPTIQGILVNNRVANVGCEGGRRDAERLARRCTEMFGDSAPYIPSSTGVIGWKLPVADMEAALPDLPTAVRRDSLLSFAEAIMTTDAWPKVRGETCGDGRITAAAKGAGMVEPNMATMLAFVLTDLDVPREAARRHLSTGVEHSFNRISIDGETSTSDTVLLLSSRRRPWPGDEAFAAVLHSVLSNLAEDVVRNGEGCSHVVRIAVTGAPDGEAAVTVARSIANAPLTKTAMRGNDPNVGRILQATGAACARLGLAPVPGDITLDIGGRRVFADGVFRLDGDEERWLAAYLRDRELPIPSPGWPRHEQRVEIAVNLGLGGAAAAVTGSDLSEEYVKINADYRT